MSASHPSTGARQYLLLDDHALLAQCDFDTYRAHGPGGQKRNKTSSAVRLRHEPTGLIVTATEERSQHINKARALIRMREAIALHVRTDVRESSFEVPNVAQYRTADGGLRINTKNEQFPLVIAEVLDVFAAQHARIGDTAEELGLTIGQLIRFLETHPKVWERVNQMRAEAGEKSLR